MELCETTLSDKNEADYNIKWKSDSYFPSRIQYQDYLISDQQCYHRLINQHYPQLKISDQYYAPTPRRRKSNIIYKNNYTNSRSFEIKS
jgi:hypothetical protein